MSEIWLKTLVWMDYRLAGFFLVSMPLIILIWAGVKKVDAVSRLMIIYWRVSSLWLISLYLMIPSWPIGFLTAIFAKILIPLCLWFWIDLNEEIQEMPKRPIKFVVRAWRWAVTVYCALGFIGSLPFLSCAFSKGAIDTPSCKVWLQAPWLYKNIFHFDSSSAFLGFLGILGLCAYVAYFIYFLLIRLGKQGRSAIEQ